MERASHDKSDQGQERVCPACHRRVFSHREFACLQVHQDQAQHQLPKVASSHRETGLDLIQTIPMPGVPNFGAFVLHPYFPST